VPSACPGIAGAAVAVCGRPRDKRLVGYLVPAGIGPHNSDELVTSAREHAAARRRASRAPHGPGTLPVTVPERTAGSASHQAKAAAGPAAAAGAPRTPPHTHASVHDGSWVIF
jgi:hypothetical protein